MIMACNLVWHFRLWMMPWITACHLTIWAKIAVMIFLIKKSPCLDHCLWRWHDTERDFWQEPLVTGRLLMVILTRPAHFTAL